MSEAEGGNQRNRAAGWFLFIGAIGCAMLALSSAIGHEWVQMVFEVICFLGVLSLALWSFGVMNVRGRRRRSGRAAP